jgi:hypothetical protein
MLNVNAMWTKAEITVYNEMDTNERSIIYSSRQGCLFPL